MAPIEEFPDDRWDALVALLLTSPFLLAKHAWPALGESGDGRFLVVASVHGLVASPFKAGYVAAKHGVLGLVKVLALEGAERGIAVAALCPGYVRTPLIEAQVAAQAAAHGIPEERVLEDVLLAPQARKQLLEPEEVAEAAAFLLGPIAFDHGLAAAPRRRLAGALGASNLRLVARDVGDLTAGEAHEIGGLHPHRVLVRACLEDDRGAVRRASCRRRPCPGSRRRGAARRRARTPVVAPHLVLCRKAELLAARRARRRACACRCARVAGTSARTCPVGVATISVLATSSGETPSASASAVARSVCSVVEHLVRRSRRIERFRQVGHGHRVTLSSPHGGHHRRPPGIHSTG